MGNNRFEVTTNLTKGLASFIKNLKYEDIPPAVIEKAKMMVMQTCGVCICGDLSSHLAADVPFDQHHPEPLRDFHQPFF